MKRLFTLATILLINFFSGSAQQWGRFTLYSIQGDSRAYLVDTNGVRYHYWRGMNFGNGYNCHLLTGGKLLRTVVPPNNGWNAGGVTGILQYYNWQGDLLWNYVLQDSVYSLHHDVEPLPNGNILAIVYERKTAAELAAIGDTSPAATWTDMIVEIRPILPDSGEIVWSWRVWDHLVQNIDSTKPNYYASIVDHPELLSINFLNNTSRPDWMHVNGIDYNDSLDQIVFSSRYNNEIYVIEKTATTALAAGHQGGRWGRGGDILYRWGNPAAYGFTSAQRQFSVVHDPHWIPEDCPGAYSLVGFDNNYHPDSSALKIIEPPYDSIVGYIRQAGAPFLPAVANHTIACLGKTSAMGNSQQLPNGNTQICISQSGIIYEIDSTGNLLWTHQVAGTVPQAFRYSACELGGGARDSAIVYVSQDTLYTLPDSTYQWYDNNGPIQGATNQFFVPGANGDYRVITTDRFGCVSLISDTFNFNTLDISESYFNERVKVLPNPTTGRFQVVTPIDTNLRLEISVYDNRGRLVYFTNQRRAIDISGYNTGIYFVRVVSDIGSAMRKIVLVNE